MRGSNGRAVVLVAVLGLVLQGLLAHLPHDHKPAGFGCQSGDAGLDPHRALTAETSSARHRCLACSLHPPEMVVAAELAELCATRVVVVRACTPKPDWGVPGRHQHPPRGPPDLS